MATRKSELVITCNAKAVKDVFDFLNRQLADVKQSLKDLNKRGEENGWTEEMKKEFKELTRQATAIDSAIIHNQQTMVKYGQVMQDLAHSKLRDVRSALGEVKRALNGMSEDDPNRTKLNKDLARLAEQIDVIGDKKVTLEQTLKSLKDLGNTSLNKLQQGLEAVRRELETEPADTQWSDFLQKQERALQAQIAIAEYGKMGTAPATGTLSSEDRIRAEAERSRLVRAYQQVSMSDDAEHKAWADKALKQIQQYNSALRDLTDTEREQARVAKEAEAAEQRRIEFAQQGQKTHQTLINLEKASYEDLDDALRHLEEQRQKYIKAGDTKHIQRNLQMQDKLKQKQVEMQKLMLSDQQISDRVNNSKKYNVIQLQQAYDQLKYKLTTLATEETKAIKETRRQMKSLEKDIKAVSGEATGLTKIWKTAVRNIATYMGVFAIAGQAKTMIKGLVSDNLKLSDSMAQVQKVTGLTSEEVKKLNVNLSKMDTRTGIEQLNELAYSAGKMGLGKYGVSGIQEFVNAANQLQVALGDDLGASVDEAITPLAKLAENLGLFEKMGVEKAMTAIGSSINELSQTTTAAGKNIVDFARRIQPSAQMIGLTTDEILALGSASDSFGISAEVSSTAFTKFLAAYRTNTEEIERILNMVPGTLDKFFDEGKAIEGLMAIFQRMHEMGDLRYLEDAFKALGSEGSKMFLTFGAFSKNIDMFREHLATSTKAFDEATSVTREYNLVQETAQGIMERSNNIWKNAFVNPDGVDMVKQLADEWYRLSRELTESTSWMTAAKTSLELIAGAVKLLIEALPTLVRLMMAYGVGAVLQGIAKNFWDIYRAVTITNSGVAKFNALLKTNAFAIAVTLLGYVVTKFIDMKYAAEDATDAVNENNAALERSQRANQAYTSTMASNYATLMEKYDKLKREWKALKSEHEKNEWIRKNKSAFEELGLSVTGAASAEEVFEKNTARVVEGFKRRAEAAALAAKMTELYRQKMDIENEAQQMVNEKGKEAGDRVYKQPPVMERDKNSNTFNNGQFILGKDGYYYYTAQGAEQYNRELLKQMQSEYDSVDKQIDDAAKRMEDLGKTPMGNTATPTSGNSGTTNNKEAKEIKDKFNNEKKRVEGLIAKIDQWYNLQDATINEFAATGKITDDEAKKALDAMKIARNIALEKARLAVASGDDTDWKKFYTENMQKMMIDHGEWSTELFKQLGDVDVKTLHDFLATIKDPEVMAKLDASSFFDTMRKKAAESKKVVSETQAKAAEELNKMLLKYEYFDKSARQFASNLVQIGALGTTAEQMAKGMEGAPTAEQSIEAVKGMLAAMLRQGTSLYKVNPSDAQGVADMIRSTVSQAMTEADYLAGKTSGEQAKWFDLFPEVKDWMDNPEQHKRELENFYNVMLQAEQDYYSKRKQSYDHEKRQHEERFRAAGYTEQESREQTAISNMGKMKDAGIGASFMEQQGLGSIAQDPEVLQIQNLIKWRKMDVDDAQARLEALQAQRKQELADLKAKQEEELALRQAAGASLDELEKLRMEHRQQMMDMEAQQNAARMGAEDLLKTQQAALYEQEIAMATKIAQELRKRVQTINQLTKPIQDGAQNVGKKFGEMIRGVEEDSMTWNEIWRSMAQAVGDSIIDMMAQYAQNMIMEKMMNQQSKSEALSKAQVDVAAGTASAAAKTVGQLGWWGLALIPVIAAVLHGLLAAAFASDKKNDTSKSSATKIKLASGMLTYDEGNVGTYLGQDGRVYRAREDAAPKTGLITKPIATTVQGQPALVAERGPEIVIGRRTTKRIQMAAPELLHAIQLIDRGYTPRRLYDEGTPLPVTVPAASPAGQQSDQDARMADTLAALTQTVAVLSATVSELQKKGIPSYINKYGKGGLIEEVKSGLKFDARYNK